MLMKGNYQSFGQSNTANVGLSRKRVFGREFTDFGDRRNTDTKRAKVVEIINIDDSGGETNDDWSLGHIHRLAVRGGQPKRREAENEVYLAEPEVCNTDVGRQWPLFLDQTISNACGFAYGDNRIGQNSEGLYVGRDVAFSPELGDSVNMFNENQFASKENSYGVSSELTADSATMLCGNHFMGQENHFIAPEVTTLSHFHHFIGQQSEDHSIGQENSYGDAPIFADDPAGMLYCSGQGSDSDNVGLHNSIGAVNEVIDDSFHLLYEESGIIQEESSEVAKQVECRRLDGSTDCEDYSCEPETEVSKGVGVSLTDSFTADQIRIHLLSLKEPDKTGDGIKSCQLCAKGDLMFIIPMDCARCLVRIKPGAVCHKTEDKQYAFCNKCFKYQRGQILVNEQSFPKKVLTKGKNDPECKEDWVQCDKCDLWQHQVCALYNAIHDAKGNKTYICPICRLKTERQGIPYAPVASTLGARELPRTRLSDHLEERLSSRLAHEREQRAESEGKRVDEVPGVEDLVIRVVLAADKQIEVKQKFLDILHGEDYPSGFPYKSKVIMLFQKIEGADVCLFAMYVQEFGSECGKPNQRCVYISYIDSVNYLTPDIKTCKGQALRTLVYHEILIGYLDYCKQHGFNTCYIWASPPVKGDDYIFYCHPETQKIPQPEKLQRWYTLMLKKAIEDNVVAEYTDFYKYFFVHNDDENKINTAARLPYFDGDFWTGAIENMIDTIGKGCKGDSKKNKPKKSTTKRTSKSMGRNDLSDKAAVDRVMETLEAAILPYKDFFFVVHLQPTCKSCREPVLPGNRWSCSQCKKFHLCERCIEDEQNGDRTHTTVRGETHALIQTTLKDVADTDDHDISIHNDHLETTHTFLKFCRENNYQFASLRKAKHSSMMTIYDLHSNLLHS